jgi:hypothetical protein
MKIVGSLIWNRIEKQICSEGLDLFEDEKELRDYHLVLV